MHDIIYKTNNLESKIQNRFTQTYCNTPRPSTIRRNCVCMSEKMFSASFLMESREVSESVSRRASRLVVITATFSFHYRRCKSCSRSGRSAIAKTRRYRYFHFVKYEFVDKTPRDALPRFSHSRVCHATLNIVCFLMITFYGKRNGTQKNNRARKKLEIRH